MKETTTPRASHSPVLACLGVATVLTALTVAPLTASASPGQSTTTLRSDDAGSLVDLLVGARVAVADVSTTGNAVQVGSFGGLVIGQSSITSGVALSSGSLIDSNPTSASDVDFTWSSILGPNKSLTTTGDLGGSGDADLEALNGGTTTYDASSLSFTVTPDSDTIELGFLFASEEYASWRDKGFSDAFGIWINGKNCAVVPGTDDVVSTATINEVSNSGLFFSNYVGNDAAAGTFDTEFNGFTSELTCTATVAPNTAATVKIAIADTVDGQLDSTVLLAKDSLNSIGTAVTPPTHSPAATPTPTKSAPATPTHSARATATPAPAVIVAGGGHPRPGTLALTGHEFLMLTLFVGGGLLLTGGIIVSVRALRRRME